MIIKTPWRLVKVAKPTGHFEAFYISVFLLFQISTVTFFKSKKVVSHKLNNLMTFAID